MTGHARRRVEPASLYEADMLNMVTLFRGRADAATAAAFVLHGPWDADRFTRTLRQVAGGHAALCSTWEPAGGGRWDRVVHDSPQARITVHERATRADAAATAARAADGGRDATAGPTWTLDVIPTADSEHVAVFVFNHAVLDGWSLMLLLRELAQALDSDRGRRRRRPGSSDLAAAAAQFDRLAQGADGEVTDAYWRHLLSPVAGPVPAWPGRARTGPGTPGQVTVRLSSAQRRSVAAAARDAGVPTAAWWTHHWGCVCATEVGADHVVVGVPMANRSRRNARTVGMFATLTYVVVTRDGNPARVAEQYEVAKRHAWSPLSRTLAATGAAVPFHATTLNYQPFGFDQNVGGCAVTALDGQPLTIASASIPPSTPGQSIEAHVSDTGRETTVTLRFDAERFQDTAERALAALRERVCR